MSQSEDPQTSRVTDKGQTTIPKELREKYGIEPGDEVVWIEDDDGIRLVRRDRSAGRGMLLPDDVDEETREAVAEALAENAREVREEYGRIE